MVNIKNEREFKKTEKQHKQEVDTELSRELELFILNQSEYHKSYEIAKNYLAKIHLKFGYIGLERSTSYLTNFVVGNAISEYRKEHDLPRVNRETKEHLANRLLEVMAKDIDYVLENTDPKEIKKALAYDDYRRIEDNLAKLKAGTLFQ